MLQKPAPDATGDVDYRLLVPVLVNSTLIHTVVSILRVTTSYRAVELDLSIVWLGVISATFAIFPIFLAVWVGRFIDRGNDAVTAWIGSGLIAVAAAGFAAFSSALALLVFTAVLGTGHLFMMAAQQMLCVRSGGPAAMDRVFGNYMVAAAIGQGLGPFVVGWAGGAATLPPTGRLFTIALIGAAVAFLIALTIRPARTLPHYIETKDVMPVTALLRRPGVAAVIACGVFIVTAQDLVLIYLPILGAERAIDVNVIGILLTVRAALSMVSRVIYARMVMEFGRDPLMVTCTFVAALAFVSLAFPIPLWAMYLAMAVMGFTLGLATTLSVTTVVDRTPASARGTANSLRIMGNRLGQVSLPFGASLVAAATGVAGIMVMIALSLAASAAAVQWSRPPQ
ncbi:MAG TPA: MFS transporter [Xanthobacteraceae bacterium]|nr:MFS transporter [Xanthobacteraceae bacterium]